MENIMPRVSAGLLVFRVRAGALEVLLGHPGGPFFQKKDDGAWTIIKGEIDPSEDLLDAARREFAEETGWSPEGPFEPLPPVKQKGGKVVHAWACRGDFDCSACASNTFQIEWPPRSGRMQEFPEIDRAEYFSLDAARRKINSAQAALLDELAALRGVGGDAMGDLETRKE